MAQTIGGEVKFAPFFIFYFIKVNWYIWGEKAFEEAFWVLISDANSK